MDKKIALTKLISYILSIQDVDESDEEEINYDLNTDNHINEIVFEFLEKNEQKVISDFPPNIKELFDPFLKEINRVGVVPFSSDKKYNISLFYSVLYCMDKDFDKIEDVDNLIFDLRKKIIFELLDPPVYNSKNYEELGWKKKELKDSLNNFKNNRMVLRVLTEYFNVNIFVLNISEDRIYSVYSDELFNTFKMNIFLSFYDEIFEPIIYKENKLWKYNDDPFKKLINVDKLKINVLGVDFKNKIDIPFQIGTENLEKYFESENKDGDEGAEDNEEDKDKDLPKVKIINKKEDEDEDEEDEEDENDENEDEENGENNFGEVSDETDDDQLLIDDPEDTEIEIESLKNHKDIFCKKNEIKKKKKVKKGKLNSDLKNLNQNMKLVELQKIAENHKISLCIGKTKAGKPKRKTKKELYDDLIKLI